MYYITPAIQVLTDNFWDNKILYKHRFKIDKSIIMEAVKNTDILLLEISNEKIDNAE